MDEMDENWIIMRQAQERTGYHPVHIRRLCAAGQIVARKIGRDWLIFWPSLEDYLKKHRGPRVPAQPQP